METTSINKPVHIEMTEDSPQIKLNAEQTEFKIEGPSYPEDAFELYKHVLDWIAKLNGGIKSKLNCDFNFKVLSSASHKMIYEILIKLETLHKKSANVCVNWYYLKYDEDLYETGVDFSEIIDIPFQFFPQ